METIKIQTEADIVIARNIARELAGTLGFSVVDKTRIATAVSELARNTLTHGGGGEMQIETDTHNSAMGIRCVFTDQGPGIPDIERAMDRGFSSGTTLGHGLPGAQRLCDDFEITSTLGQGTRVEIAKWKA